MTQPRSRLSHVLSPLWPLSRDMFPHAARCEWTPWSPSATNSYWLLPHFAMLLAVIAPAGGYRPATGPAEAPARPSHTGAVAKPNAAVLAFPWTAGGTRLPCDLRARVC